MAAQSPDQVAGHCRPSSRHDRGRPGCRPETPAPDADQGSGDTGGKGRQQVRALIVEDPPRPGSRAHLGLGQAFGVATGPEVVPSGSGGGNVVLDDCTRLIQEDVLGISCQSAECKDPSPRNRVAWTRSGRDRWRSLPIRGGHPGERTCWPPSDCGWGRPGGACRGRCSR